ncbi:MAG: hypothetical protein ACP5Q5_01150 [Brevinematia bacterium]
MSPKVFDIDALVSEVVEEIMRYKWLESEKAGRDIGENEAAKRWITEHYDLWFNATKDKFVKDS